MGLVVAGGVIGFWAAGAGLLLGLSPGAALGLWAGSGPVAAGVAMLASRPRAARGDGAVAPGEAPACDAFLSRPARARTPSPTRQLAGLTPRRARRPAPGAPARPRRPRRAGRPAQGQSPAGEPARPRGRRGGSSGRQGWHAGRGVYGPLA